MKPRALAVVALLLLLSACVEPLADCPLPEDFDAALLAEVRTPAGGFYPANAPGRSHRVYRPTADPRPELVVHLPGLSNEPENQTLLLEAAAFTGFRAIGLVWTNGTLVASDCEFAADFNDCLETTRDERGFAPDPESVQSELAVLLAALDVDYPLDGWGDFLTAGIPDWDEIVLTGYSEGGNQGAYMAKQVAFHSVILISGGGNFGTPPPNTTGDPIADWLTQPGATRGDDHFAMYHEREPFAADYVGAYDTIGVPSISFSRVAEDQVTGWPDFGLASRLVVHDLSAPVNPATYPNCDPHGTTVPDACMDYGLGETTYDLFKARIYLFCRAGNR
jgi:hypothetical protein